MLVGYPSIIYENNKKSIYIYNSELQFLHNPNPRRSPTQELSLEIRYHVTERQRGWPRCLRSFSNNIRPIRLSWHHSSLFPQHVPRKPTFSVPLTSSTVLPNTCKRHPLQSKLPCRIRADVCCDRSRSFSSQFKWW